MTVKAKRPVFLAVIVLIIAVLILLLLGSIYIAIFATPDSTFQIIGESMLMSDVRTELLAILTLWLAISAYSGLGLWRGNSIARHVFFGLLIAMMSVETYVRQALNELPLLVLTCGLVAWYLYAKPSVKRFFEGT